MKTRQNIRKSAISKKGRHIKYPIGTGAYKDHIYDFSVSTILPHNMIIVSFSISKNRLPETIHFTMSELKESGIINERALSKFVEKKLRK